METEDITGKVARVLNSREVALNIGRDHGVKRGMVFEILSPNADTIFDPDSHALLGSVNLPKVRVKITYVESNFSVATTFRSKRVDVGGLGTFQPPKWETRYETLKRGESFESAAEPLGSWESYVEVGDPVIQVEEGPRTALEAFTDLIKGSG